MTLPALSKTLATAPSCPLRYSRCIMLLARLVCFFAVAACVGHGIGKEIEIPGHESDIPHSPEERACAAKGMTHVVAPDKAGAVCEPQGTDISSRIINCLFSGMEAVLIPDRNGVVCARPFMGTVFLDDSVWPVSGEKRYLRPEITDSKSICDQRLPDKRVLDARFVKELFRKSATAIDTIGIRIIGGIYCQGLDLSGMDIPFSLILDRSIFRSRLNVRNFHTKGDLSVDSSVMYGSFRINRAEISGSVYATVAFIRSMDVSDSIVKGSVNLDHSVVLDLLNIENLSVEGDLDVTTSFFSNLEILKDKIGGVLDLSQSQARCSYDVRKNEIGDMVAAQLGFGTLRSSTKGLAVYNFKKISNDSAFGRPLPPARNSQDNKPMDDPYDLYTSPESQTAAEILDKEACEAVNFIKPGTFVVVDNHIKSSLCVRSFNWLTDLGNNPLESNIYFNEDTIGGATWLNIARTQASSTVIDRQAGARFSEPMLSIFNLTTGTLVLDFGLAVQNVSLTVNGLHFERIYNSKADCESALSLRYSGTPGKPTPKEIAFPPALELPKTEQVLDWINKNRFAHTQQPFAEFVAVFERAGDSEGAKELKIRAANAASKSTFCDLFGVCSRADTLEPDSTDKKVSRQKTIPELIKALPDFTWSMIVNGVLWCEKLVVAILDLMLWVLADHGYKPERIGWFVLGTVVCSMFVFPYCLGIVGYSVETAKDKIKPISILFLFDRLLPAYRMREEHYKIEQYYVVSKTPRDQATIAFRHLGKKWLVMPATEQHREKIERYLDILKFTGLVFTIFIIAAISKLAR